MISGFSNERVSYRTRYLHFPSTMVENVPSITKPTVHVVKIRFNNIVKNEKILFGIIAVSLSVLSLAAGLGLYSVYSKASSGMFEEAPIAIEELSSIKADDNGVTVLNKVSGAPGSSMSGANQGGSFLSFNNGGGSNPLLLASNDSSSKANVSAVSKKSIVEVEDKISVNPFLPAADVDASKKSKPNPYYVLPPASPGVDSDAALLLKTVVSGIMYDAYSPSAIIKINDVDYLVKKGDHIQGYDILGITSNAVTIKRGSNTFHAKVGRNLATLDANTTGTYNISGKFGGGAMK